MSSSHRIPTDPELIRQEQARLHNQMASLSRSCREAVLALGPEHMQADLSNFGLALRRRRAILQAEHALLSGPTAAVPPARHAPSPPPAPVVSEHEHTDDDNAPLPAEEGESVLRVQDQDWTDVSQLDRAAVYLRPMEGGDGSFATVRGALRLQAATDGSNMRRFVMHSQSGRLQLNVRAPETHTLAIVKQKQQEYGVITFMGVNGVTDDAHGGAASEPKTELIRIKCVVTEAQKLSAELGGRST